MSEPMRPSARERAKPIFEDVQDACGVRPLTAESRTRKAICAAYNDGIAAGRAEIVRELREGDERLYRDIAERIRATALAMDGVATSDDFAVIAVGALADYLDRKPEGSSDAR